MMIDVSGTLNLTDHADNYAVDTSGIRYLSYKEMPFTPQQRLIMSAILILLIFFAIAGNAATFAMAIRSRKVRPVFRTCLMSLAVSDILSALVTAINYMAVLYATYPQLWTLGGLMCKLIPFMDVLGNLVNSMTLVAIALDRYLSVTNITRNSLEQGKPFCILAVVMVWGLSAAISYPALNSYIYREVNMVICEGSGEYTVTVSIVGYMCGATKVNNAQYYTIIFSILFMPMLFSFVWFNTAIAIDIWKRRKGIPTESSRYSTNIGLDSATFASAQDVSSENCSDFKKRARSNREMRQLRMFVTVILLIISYMLLNLPEWIYLIVTFYDHKSVYDTWILEYTFNMVSMIGYVVNPVLYAFVTQTMQYMLDIYFCLRNYFCGTCKQSVEVLSRAVVLSLSKTNMQNMSEDK